MALVLKTQNNKHSKELLWINITLPNGEVIKVTAKIGVTGSNKGSAQILVDADRKYKITRGETILIPQEYGEEHYQAEARKKRRDNARIVSSLDLVDGNK